MKARLYCVAMPIGNADDISARAVEILSTVDIIAAEDTRKLKDWIRRCAIHTDARFLAHHARNEAQSAPGLLKLLQDDNSIAIVSDGGTPLISDPGSFLVRLCYENSIPVVPVPGPSALTAICSICPFPIKPLLFLGFLPKKAGKLGKILDIYADFEGAVLIYESIHRIEKLLAAVISHWGDVEILVVRELTKQYEDIYWGKLSQIGVWVANARGELAIMIHKR